MMTVGEVARAVGVSPKAIRLWESRGLVPEVARTATGYRAFTDADVSTMRFIRQAKTLGLTLGEIRDILEVQQAGTCPCDQVLQAIDGHLLAIDASIAELVQLRRTLTAAKMTAQEQLAQPMKTGHCHIIERTQFAGS